MRHVICDAAWDADQLGKFIVDERNATAQIKPNPSRATQPETDRHLNKERHLVEFFFNRIKRFRRIALGCDATITSFQAFVDLACAMAWISKMQTPPRAFFDLNLTHLTRPETIDFNALGDESCFKLKSKRYRG